jgi:hypothetical protein
VVYQDGPNAARPKIALNHCLRAILHPRVWLWIYDMGSDEQHREDHPWQNFFGYPWPPDVPFFFYSTTLLASYFYSLDWAPIRILTSIGESFKVGCEQLKFSQNLLSLAVIFFIVYQAIIFELLK